MLPAMPADPSLAVVGGIGPAEIAIVLALALLILGPKRLPDAGRALGRGMREFKDGVTGTAADEPQTLDRASPP